MQSNESTVSSTLLASPAESTISNPFIPTMFSTEGQGVKATLVEAFLSWCPTAPSSWQIPLLPAVRTPSPVKSTQTMGPVSSTELVERPVS